MNWKYHVNDVAVKLNRVNALLFKITNSVNVYKLKTIYYAIFDSHFNYKILVIYVVWAQNSVAMNRVFTLQKKGPESYFSTARLLFKPSV